MAVILGSERALFNRYIVEADLNVDDFKIGKESDATWDHLQSGTGTVTVTYTPPTSATASTPTEIVRHYRDGVVPPPYVEFEQDLKMNIFKTR